MLPGERKYVIWTLRIGFGIKCKIINTTLHDRVSATFDCVLFDWMEVNKIDITGFFLMNWWSELVDCGMWSLWILSYSRN